MWSSLRHSPAAPATIPQHDKLRPVLCHRRAATALHLPQAARCHSSQPVPWLWPPALHSPRACFRPCWPSCDRGAGSLLLHVLRQTRTCQSCVCHAIGVTHQKSNPLLFCASTSGYSIMSHVLKQSALSIACFGETIKAVHQNRGPWMSDRQLSSKRRWFGKGRLWIKHQRE